MNAGSVGADEMILMEIIRILFNRHIRVTDGREWIKFSRLGTGPIEGLTDTWQ
jgi:hypothetical protein